MSKPLKILFVVHNQTRKGGAYYRGLNLGAPLARRGHDVTLMSIHPSRPAATRRARAGRREARGVSGSAVGRRPHGLGSVEYVSSVRCGSDVGVSTSFIRSIRDRPCRCRRCLGARPVAPPGSRTGPTGGAAAARRPSGMGGLIRTLIGPLEQFFEEKPRPHADGTVVISHALGRRAEALGIDGKDILYLPPGADPAAIREHAHRRGARRNVARMPAGR